MTDRLIAADIDPATFAVTVTEQQQELIAALIMAVDAHSPLLNPHPKRKRVRGNGQGQPSATPSRQSFAAISIPSASPSPVKAHKERDRQPEKKPSKPCVEDSHVIKSICKNLEAPGQVDVGATARALGYTNAGSVADRIGRLKREGVKFTCVGRGRVPKSTSNATTATSRDLRRSPRKNPRTSKGKITCVIDDSGDEDYCDEDGGEEEEVDDEDDEDEDVQTLPLKRRARRQTSMKQFMETKTTSVRPAVPAIPATPAADADDDDDEEEEDEDESGWWSSDSLKELLEKARQRTAQARQAMGIKKTTTTKEKVKVKPEDGK